MSRNEGEHYLTFTLDGLQYALRLHAVEICVRAVAITPLPKAPPVVTGIINVAGRIVPVVSLRQRFRLPERPIDPADEIIIARTARRPVALVVDAVGGLLTRPASTVVGPEEVLPGLDYVDGVVTLEDGGIVLIHDIDRFLSLEEARAIDDAMEYVR